MFFFTESKILSNPQNPLTNPIQDTLARAMSNSINYAHCIQVQVHYCINTSKGGKLERTNPTLIFRPTLPVRDPAEKFPSIINQWRVTTHNQRIGSFVQKKSTTILISFFPFFFYELKYLVLLPHSSLTANIFLLSINQIKCPQGVTSSLN